MQYLSEAEIDNCATVTGKALAEEPKVLTHDSAGRWGSPTGKAA